MARTANYDRDAALEAAMTLFWRKGYHASSLKDLEEALQLKPGSIYAAFTSKQNLYLLALERYFEKSRQAFREQLQAAKSPLGGMADHIRSYARLEADHRERQACMLTRTIVDTRSTDPAIAKVTRDYLGTMQREFASVFTNARSKGELAPASDPQRLARRFQSNVTALRLALHQDMPGEELLQLAEDMALEIERLRLVG